MLGRPALGRVAPGIPADLLILSADPLTDLTNLQGGRLFRAADLHATDKR